MHKRGIVAVALVGLLLAALAGPAAAREHQGWIRAFHNSPDTPAVDIWVNGDKTLSGVTYGDLSEYLRVPQGAYDIAVKVAPSDADDPAALSRRVAVGARPVTVAAIGSLTGDGAGLRLKVVRDAKSTRDAVSKIRVAHTSPDAPSVNVQVKVDGDYATVLRNVEFGDVSRYLRVPPGSYDLRVVAAADPSLVVIDLPGTQLAGGTAATAWATGFLGNSSTQPPFGVVVTVDG